MIQLSEQKCVPHDQMIALNSQEIKNFLDELGGGWEFIQANKIAKTYKFDDFVKAVEFVNKIVPVAEAENHHPDISIHYNKVEISLWSHFINGLSINDFIMAAKIDQIK